MNHNNGKTKKKRTRKLKSFCVILVLWVAILSGAVLASQVIEEHRANPQQSIINKSFKTKQQKNSTTSPDEPQWNILLVNPWNKLPDDFSVELTNLNNGQAIDKRAYPDLQAMMDDARAEGLSPLICSSYRTDIKQETLFKNQIKKYIAKGYDKDKAKQIASTWVAVPGTSEHQTGLALDIVATSYQVLDENQANTAEQKWLMENSYKYGFILRYPVDKSEITGISYEPWHYRYVGKEVAEEIYSQDICFEEYLENTPNHT